MTIPRLRATLAAITALLTTSFPALAASDAPGGYDVVEKSVAQLQADLRAGRVTSEELVRAYLARIEAVDRSGPELHSIVALNPHARDDARRADAARARGTARGPLAGVPILVKDNIETSDGTATTAGSIALAHNVTRRDAALVVRLKRAGAIILGKTNLSEWANFRSTASISGWSGVGGLTKNAYALDRTACGSSSGSGAAVAASLAAAAVGTETDGSVTCPAAIDGLAGLKPTLGLVSRAGVVPLSHDQDTPGPMGRSVGDIAALLGGLAGSDGNDPATRAAAAHAADYVAAARSGTLAGKRLGIARYATAFASPALNAVFTRAVARLRAAGAIIVEIPQFKPDAGLGDAEFEVLLDDFKADINRYLSHAPAAVSSRSLRALIAFDRTDPRELGLFGQDIFERAQATSGPADPKYRAALALCRRAAGPEGIDRLRTRYRLDALIAPTYSPASRIDIVSGDNVAGSIGTLAAVAGYPHLTVPMGAVRGLPVGLSFVGGAWSDARLLGIGAAFERAMHARSVPRYLPSIEGKPSVERLFAPLVTPEP